MSDTRYILVTGANRGIGRATVAALLDAHDDTHAFLGSRDEARGEEARASIVDESPEAKGRIDVLPLDVSDDDSVTRAAELAADRLGDAPLYGLVNNAGVGDRTRDIREVLDVNVRGPRRVCEAFIPMMHHPDGRIVNVSSASGPKFVRECREEHRELLTDDSVTWEAIASFMETCIEAAEAAGDFDSTDIGNGSAYGLSKALLNAYTMELARNHPELTINACTPGFIETGMTRPMAERRGKEPEELGMKPPEEGVTAQMFLLFDDPEGHGWYYGSDAVRSPLDRYRDPGDPPYTGD